jgi:LysR family transcriptional regulator, low CO2-responsive transcriptional regulator
MELGVPIFKKNGKKFSLTEFGTSLAEKADLLFSYEQQIEEFVEDYQLSRKGKLEITATYLPANFLIPRWAAAFKAENEDIELSITTTNSKGAFEQLMHHKADIAMYAGGLADQIQDVEWEDLFEDEIWFVVFPA